MANSSNDSIDKSLDFITDNYCKDARKKITNADDHATAIPENHDKEIILNPDRSKEIYIESDNEKGGDGQRKEKNEKNEAGDKKDGDGVKEPPAWLQEKRFDIERARNMLTIEEYEPDDIDDYTKLPDETTTVFSKWNKCHEVLGDMCNWLISLAQYHINPLTSAARRKRIEEILTDFTHRYAEAMEGKFNITCPWGGNWYQFSITSTLMLFYFQMICTDSTERDFAGDLILNIIVTPKKSLGQERTGANTVYMALPWITAHYFKGDVDKAAQDPAYEYMKSYPKLVEERYYEGLYLDYTYIMHTNVVAYGYLYEMVLMSRPLIGMDNEMPNFVDDWQKCQHILGHKTIGYGGIGLHTRSKEIRQFTVENGTYGIKVIPNFLYLRMYGEKYAFSMRGQVPWIAYYESDKTYDDMAQYWVQCRRVFLEGQCYSAMYPDVGFLHQQYTDSTEKTEVTTRCRIPTRTCTTTKFFNGPTRKIQPLQAGFVFAYGKIGILRHFYNCPEMIYKKEQEYGRFCVDEFVLCDYEQHTVDIWIKIIKAMPAPFVFHGDNERRLIMDKDDCSGIFHIHWDCKTGVCSENYRSIAPTADEISLVYPKGIEVVDTDNTVMLLENNEPKIAMYPGCFRDLKSNFITRYQGQDYKFAFDPEINQYKVG